MAESVVQDLSIGFTLARGQVFLLLRMSLSTSYVMKSASKSH